GGTGVGGLMDGNRGAGRQPGATPLHYPRLPDRARSIRSDRCCALRLSDVRLARRGNAQSTSVALRNRPETCELRTRPDGHRSSEDVALRIEARHHLALIAVLGHEMTEAQLRELLSQETLAWERGRQPTSLLSLQSRRPIAEVRVTPGTKLK